MIFEIDQTLKRNLKIDQTFLFWFSVQKNNFGNRHLWIGQKQRSILPKEIFLKKLES